MKQIFSLLLVAVTMISEASADPYKIGVSVALTGNAKTYGEDMRKSLEFAKKKLGTADEKLFFEDDKCEGKEAVTVAHKLIDIEKVNVVVGSACSGSTISPAPLYNAAKTVIISPSASAEAVSHAGDYVFRTWPSDVSTVNVLAHYMKKHHKRVGMLTEETDYARSLENSFRTLHPDLKIESESFLTNETDFRTALAKFKSKKVEALFLNTQTEATFAAALKQARSIKWGTPIYSAYWPGTPAAKELAGAQLEGVIYADGPSVESRLNEEGKKLYREYVAEYGEPVSLPFLFATTFEAYRAVGLGMKSGRPLKDYLYTTKFDGVFGPYSFDKNGDIVGLDMVLMEIKNGKPVSR